MQRYKLLSALLDYPTAELQAAAPELWEIVEEDPGLTEADRAALRTLIQELAETDLLTAQEAYSGLFDLGEKVHLHMTHFRYGDTQERGQQLVAMDQFYRAHGFVGERVEVPDYLPLMLEFAGERSEAGESLLAEFVDIYGELEAKLAEAESPYAAVFTVLKNHVCPPVAA
ncbi:MAG: nitrate reductase molybdenum cofactor assembly chaperone [Thiohalospira sp.]|uniref:nitrate reductase molybdenum cofactor assembly chaperone n=1 Tax=Thiohalorhabdus sp. TaxID=3094134 RepID=UPI003980CFAC